MIIIKKENLAVLWILKFQRTTNWKTKKSERQLLRHCQRIEKAVEDEGDGYSNCDWCTSNGPQRLGKRTGNLGNPRMNRDYPGNSIIVIGGNILKRPGDLRQLLTLVWRICREWIRKNALNLIQTNELLT